MAVILREFLGWDLPLVKSVTARLAESHPDLDFAKVVVVVPGGRAGRRIMALLAAVAAERRLPMYPPRILTSGELPDHLCTTGRNLAGTLARRMAWVDALKQAEPETRRILFPLLDAAEGLAPWLGPAALLERCARDLAGGGKRIGDVAGEAAQGGLGSEERWQAAGTIYQGYLDALASKGLQDPQEARLAAIESGALTNPGTIALAGVVELNRQTRQMLERVDGAVESWVFAPATLADCFDDAGCVDVDKWCQAQVDLAGVEVRTALGPAHQAEEVFAALARMGEQAQTDQVTVGVPDPALAPYLQLAARTLGDLPIRYAAGTPVLHSRPCRLLSIIGELLRTRGWGQYAEVVGHPDVQRWIGDCLKAPQAQPTPRWRDWRTLLDEYTADYLPHKLADEMATAAGWRYNPTRPATAEACEPLAWLFRQVRRLLEPLEQVTTQSASDWAGPILQLLQSLYGSEKWNIQDPLQDSVVQACTALHKAAGELHALADDQPLSADEAIRLLQSLLAGQTILPASCGDEIELVGWLELMPDDAEHLVITGMNEGLVPEGGSVDPFLTDSVRQRLGLPCDRQRWARDACLLTSMIRSRPPGHVTLITGRLGAGGDPLLPSRLLFACAAPEMARRTLDMVDDAKIVRPPLVYLVGPGKTSGFVLPAKAAITGIVAPDSMRVTSFRDYLASPRGFFLKHVLRLQTLAEPDPGELDPLQSGTLVHTVLQQFGQSERKASISRDEILEQFTLSLDAIVMQKLGGTPPPAARFQVELMRKRLEHLADWQARRAEQGWRIEHVELDTNGQASLEVDGTAMRLRGRIDRIDRHNKTGEWAILDYKSGAKKKPNETHLRAGRWSDLQLPLYRHLARHITGDTPVHLGYVSICDNPSEIGEEMANWDPTLLDQADEAAREVVRKVRRLEFDDIGDDPPQDGAFANIFGENILQAGDSSGKEDAQ